MNRHNGLRFDRTQPAHLRDVPWDDEAIWPRIKDAVGWLFIFGLLMALLFVALSLEAPLK